MKITATTILLFFVSNIFAQLIYYEFPYQDYDVDSIKYSEFMEGDSINGDLYGVTEMDYVDNLNRDVSEYYIEDDSRVLFALVNERINNIGDPTYSELVSLVNGQFDSETISELSYSQGNLISVNSEADYSGNQNVQYNSITYENYDQYNNYGYRNNFQLDELGNINHQVSYKLEHTYTSQYLDSVSTYRVDLNTNDLQLENISIFNYNDEGNVVSVEIHGIYGLGIKEFDYRYEYSYNEKGLIDQFIYIEDINSTPDPWDSRIFHIVDYIYDQFDRITQERYYSINEDDVKYLTDVVEYLELLDLPQQRK